MDNSRFGSETAGISDPPRPSFSGSNPDGHRNGDEDDADRTGTAEGPLSRVSHLPRKELPDNQPWMTGVIGGC